MPGRIATESAAASSQAARRVFSRALRVMFRRPLLTMTADHGRTTNEPDRYGSGHQALIPHDHLTLTAGDEGDEPVGERRPLGPNVEVHVARQRILSFVHRLGIRTP